MPLVEVKNLSVHFGAFAALSGISFAVEPGERFGIIGESGSGKSMTALAIAGLLPDEAVQTGEILFEGSPLPQTDAEMARLRGSQIGLVFQEPMTALNPLMRVGKQIGEAVRLHFPQAQANDRTLSLLQEVGLEPRHTLRYPHQLSGGQRQRVMIAMALASEPELLICDEPTSALDLITQRRILNLLEEVCARRNMALVFISHDLKAVASLCKNMLVLKAGEQVETGAATAIFAAPETKYTQALVTASRMEFAAYPAPRDPDPMLVVERVSKNFSQPGLGWLGARDGLKAVDDVSFQIGAGEALALVGPSGCGKTTLARMIAGLDQPSGGTLALDGRHYGARRNIRPAIRREISLVFQDPFGSFDPHMSVGESLSEPLQLLPGLAPTDRVTRICQVVEAVGLEIDALKRFPHAFSGGQRQRLAIARAIITRPKLVILDEPVSALDLSLRGDILELFNDLRAEFGLAYLMISHDLDMVRAVSDRVMVMEAGKIVESGRPLELFGAPQHRMTQELLAARLPDLESPQTA